MTEYKDTELSHGYLNYVYALLQGKMASINMLHGFHLAESSEQDSVKGELQKVSIWFNDLWKGVCILSTQWNSAETFESKELLEELSKLQLELRELRDDLAALFASEITFPLDTNVRALLTACLARAVYSKDNYLRGLKKLSDFFKKKDSVESLTQSIKAHANEVQLVHSFYVAMQSETYTFNEELERELILECGTLSGRFGCQVHDISQMVSRFNGDFSFEKSEIPFEEQRAWRELGAPAMEAGYWHAYGFGASDALNWRQLGVLDHNTAGLWNWLGFTPLLAAPWHFAGFHPRKAYEWASANYIPEQALELTRLGFSTPRIVPAETEAKIRQEIDRPFGPVQEAEQEWSSNDFWEQMDNDTESSDVGLRGGKIRTEENE